VEPDCVSVLAKLSGARIKLEVAKALGQGRLRSLCHDPSRFARSLTPQGASGKDCLLVLVHMISGTGGSLHFVETTKGPALLQVSLISERSAMTSSDHQMSRRALR
jgi:hypothetical protein